ncbi:MAG TPA: hypothetical protein VF304_07070 [Casimicrobiaceae bacterium]
MKAAPGEEDAGDAPAAADGAGADADDGADDADAGEGDAVSVGAATWSAVAFPGAGATEVGLAGCALVVAGGGFAARSSAAPSARII